MNCGTSLKQSFYEKNRTDSLIKKLIIIVLRFYRGCLFATLSMALFAFIGSTLHIDEAGDTIYAMFSLLMVIGSIAIAIFLELRIGRKKNSISSVSVDTTPIPSDKPSRISVHNSSESKAGSTLHVQDAPKPSPVQVSSPIVSSADTTHSERIKAEADAIVQRMREATIAELQTKKDASHDEVAATENSNVKVVPPPKIKSFTARATGMEHYMDNIRKLAAENPDYDLSKKEIIDNGLTDEKIWKYDFYCSKAELVPEPENPYDQNAIKVVVDGLQVGHIKAGSCVKILNKIKAGKIRGVSCDIGGGPYKIVREDYEEDSYDLECGTSKYFVHLTIYESTEE